jgi:4-amino-4-deoxy-L-arabinose transferase-like glycosyltransferase
MGGAPVAASSQERLMRLNTAPQDIVFDPAREHRAGRLGLRAVRVAGRVGAALAVPVGLYGLAAGLLLAGIGDHPGFSYNWEDFTIQHTFAFLRHPSWDLFGLTEGLMTDSGKSPLVLPLIWLGFKVGGVGLAAMRAPIALVAALAGPLLWLVGRRLVGPGVAGLAAVLLALSPVFLLYGRTATNVGLSLVPMLASVYTLQRVLAQPRRWGWLLALQGLLLLSAYAYAPIRFLWPLSLGLLALAWLRQPAVRRPLALAVALTALTLPAALSVTQGTAPLPAINAYYNGRGEQIRALTDRTQSFARYLHVSPQEQAAAAVLPPAALAARLLLQNATDYLKLLLDWETRPTLVDYWNAQGRQYAPVLVPFFWIGLAGAAWRARRHFDDRMQLILFFGFSLPLLLTSGVHVGRLIFALPFLLLLTARGIAGVLGWLQARWTAWQARRAGPGAAWLQVGLPVVLPVALVAVVAWSTWVDYSPDPPPTAEARIAAQLRADLPQVRQQGGGVALVLGGAAGLEVETINSSAYRVELADVYRLVNLAEESDPVVDLADPRPPLYVGALLDRLAEPGQVPGYCINTYYVTPALEEPFLTVMQRRRAVCAQPAVYRLLP